MALLHYNRFEWVVTFLKIPRYEDTTFQQMHILDRHCVISFKVNFNVT